MSDEEKQKISSQEEEQRQKERIVISVLKRIFGNPKQEREGQQEWEFNCPSHVCRPDRNKFNLWFNSKNNIFQCWKCKYRGTIHKLVEDYGTKEEVDRINLIVPRIHKPDFAGNSKDHELQKDLTCKLPYGFKKLSFKNKSEVYKESIKYIKSRRVDKEKIEKYNIGYVEEEGCYKDRIIVPSYNSEGNLNYFVGRTIHDDVKPSYQIPSKKKIKKHDIIFNEFNVNFDLPVYLVEGAFDMFPMYNVVPLLGKIPPPPLIEKLIKHKSRVIICLDEDAIRDSVELYNKLMSFGLDVYFVEVKSDIAKFYEDNGKEELIKLLKNFKKLDLKFIIKLKMKDVKENKQVYTEKFLMEEWEKLKKEFEKIAKE